MDRVVRLSVLSATVFLGWVGMLQGATIATLYNTGIGDSGAPLSDLAVDPHYTLISAPAGSGLGTGSYVVDSSKFPLDGAWLSNSSTSKWIAPQGDQSTFSNDTGSGYYTYRTTIDLSGLDPTTAVITGRWMTDNAGVDILLNGASTGFTSGGFTYDSFAIDSGFVSDLNTLDFVVLNLRLAGENKINPTGLRVEMTGTAEALNSVPEPSSLSCLLGLFGAGFLGCVAKRRRKG